SFGATRPPCKPAGKHGSVPRKAAVFELSRSGEDMHYMETQERRSNPVALSLALTAFAVCFFAWSMFGPLSPTLQDHLGLSDFQLAVAVAVPVVLGSVM